MAHFLDVLPPTYIPQLPVRDVVFSDFISEGSKNLTMNGFKFSVKRWIHSSSHDMTNGSAFSHLAPAAGNAYPS